MSDTVSSSEETGQRDPRTYAIIGAAMEVHTELGRGFLEAVYEESLAMEFDTRSIPYTRQPRLAVEYKGRILPVSYQPDFICIDEIVVEIKALSKLTTVEHAQIINYLTATRKNVGLLLNFGADKLEWKRFVRSQYSRATGGTGVEAPV